MQNDMQTCKNKENKKCNVKEAKIDGNNMCLLKLTL